MRGCGEGDDEFVQNQRSQERLAEPLRHQSVEVGERRRSRLEARERFAREARDRDHFPRQHDVEPLTAVAQLEGCIVAQLDPGARFE